MARSSEIGSALDISIPADCNIAFPRVEGVAKRTLRLLAVGADQAEVVRARHVLSANTGRIVVMEPISAQSSRFDWIPMVEPISDPAIQSRHR